MEWDLCKDGELPSILLRPFIIIIAIHDLLEPSFIIVIIIIAIHNRPLRTFHCYHYNHNCDPPQDLLEPFIIIVIIIIVTHNCTWMGFYRPTRLQNRGWRLCKVVILVQMIENVVFVSIYPSRYSIHIYPTQGFAISFDFVC